MTVNASNSVRKKTSSQSVSDRLMQEILKGTYRPGDKLPTERELASEFDVTRPVIRESLKRLEALDMVSIRQGSGIYAKEIPLYAGLKLLEHDILGLTPTLNRDTLKDYLEFHGIFIAEIVRIAAARRSEEDIETLRANMEEHKRNSGDPERLNELNISLYESMAAATHNSIFKVVFSALGAGTREMHAVIPLTLLNTKQVQRFLEELVTAIEKGDSEMAVLLATRQNKRVTLLVDEYLNMLERES